MNDAKMFRTSFQDEIQRVNVCDWMFNFKLHIHTGKNEMIYLDFDYTLFLVWYEFYFQLHYSENLKNKMEMLYFPEKRLLFYILIVPSVI